MAAWPTPGRGIHPISSAFSFAGGGAAELARSGWAAIRNLLAVGIILDLVFQLLLYGSVHPGAALVVGPIFIGGPYALSRALSNRVASWSRGKGGTT